MNTIVIAKKQRKAGALLAYLIAGAGLLSSMPALAVGAIYDAQVDELKITAIKAISCTNKLNQKPLHLDASNNVTDTEAGTVTVTCTGAANVALAIATNEQGPYTKSAGGAPGAGASGSLIITVGGAGTTPTTLASGDNHTTKNITEMVVFSGAGKDFTLTPAGTVTAAGEFDYSLASAAWVE